MDGTGLGRANAPHREPSTAFRTPRQQRSFTVWHSVERGRRVISRAHGESAVGVSGSIDTAVIPRGLYTVEAKNPFVYIARSLPWGDANSDRMGRGFGRNRPPCLVSVFHS